jgi:hypothetical protein
MTRKSTRLSHLVLAFTFVLLSFGCQTRSVTIEIPGFGNGEIDGVWLWRFTSSTGKYERSCRLELSDPQFDESGNEVLPYLQVCNDPGEIGMNLQATISRLAADPDTIIVTMWYFRYRDPGQYKASSYNSAGESALSPTALSL